MKRVAFRGNMGFTIRLIAETMEEQQILKDLVSSRIRWFESDFNVHKQGDMGYIDLVDEVAAAGIPL